MHHQNSQPYIDKNHLQHIETEARTIARRLAVEKEILRNKKLFQEMEEELQNYEKQIQKIKREIIKQRMSEVQSQRKQRHQVIRAANQQVLHLKKKEKQKKTQIQEKLKRQKQQYESCYNRALLERRKHLNPIDFSQIREHQKNYISRKLKTQEPEAYKMLRSQSQEKSPKLPSKIARSVIQHYEYQRLQESLKKNKIKEHIKKRIKYGNEVERQYLKNRVKTENTRLERLEKEDRKRQLQKQHYIKNLKKPKLLPLMSAEKAQKHQLKKIKNSTELTTEEKFSRLNIMSGNYDLKARRGNPEALDQLSKINIVKADLCLDMIL